MAFFIFFFTGVSTMKLKHRRVIKLKHRRKVDYQKVILKLITTLVETLKSQTGDKP
jgi:hypothetical protein